MFDLPGSLPYTALAVLISCNPVATSETNQTAESSLFLIRKVQDNHLTLWFLSELQAASTEKKTSWIRELLTHSNLDLLMVFI